MHLESLLNKMDSLGHLNSSGISFFRCFVKHNREFACSIIDPFPTGLQINMEIISDEVFSPCKFLVVHMVVHKTEKCCLTLKKECIFLTTNQAVTGSNPVGCTCQKPCLIQFRQGFFVFKR